MPQNFNNDVSAWIDARLDFGFLPHSVAYASYRHWCTENGLAHGHSEWLSGQLLDKGFVLSSRGGRMGYAGWAT